MKKLMQGFMLMLMSSITFAYAASEKVSGNIAVHIAKTHYLHPVRLLHPFLDVWHMKGPLAEKAAMAALQKHFPNAKECTNDSQADVVLLLEPHLFYNPQLMVFHAEYIARVYTSADQPITRIKKQAEQLGNLNITPDFYMEKAYTKSINKVIQALTSDQAFLAALDKNSTISAGDLCNKLDYLPLDKLYY
jgi:hypothetical protein